MISVSVHFKPLTLKHHFFLINMSFGSSKMVNFKYLIEKALQNHYSWKALGNFMEEMGQNFSEYKQLVLILLTELGIFHKQKPEINEFHENRMATFETFCDKDHKVYDFEQENQSEVVLAIKITEKETNQMCESNQNTKAKDKGYFKCDICHTSFKHKQNLQFHQMTHTGERPFECEMCDKTFTNQKGLRRHKMVHTNKGDELMFECNVCPKSFKFKTKLQNHQRTHTGEKPFECKTCGTRFSMKQSLKTHSYLHTGEKPYHCKLCTKKFSDPATLKRHERLHTGERSYKCELCEKSFTQLSGLTKHNKTHIGEKSYQCEICKTYFKRSDTLRRHHNNRHMKIVEIKSEI